MPGKFNITEQFEYQNVVLDTNYAAHPKLHYSSDTDNGIQLGGNPEGSTLIARCKAEGKVWCESGFPNDGWALLKIWSKAGFYATWEGGSGPLFTYSSENSYQSWVDNNNSLEPNGEYAASRLWCPQNLGQYDGMEIKRAFYYCPPGYIREKEVLNVEWHRSNVLTGSQYNNIVIIAQTHITCKIDCRNSPHGIVESGHHGSWANEVERWCQVQTAWPDGGPI